ncbi:MAG: 50S ribosomal protein L2 [Simkaniaceae bacterium]|nr:50S ribosomal protein L2 [Simkaniaceae bacterium]
MKKLRPVTPGRRRVVLPTNGELTRLSGTRKTVKPLKGLLVAKKRASGRNHHGRITCRHRGGGHKRFYRSVDYRRDKDRIRARVASIEYDPGRSAHLALLHYTDGEKRYIIAPATLKVGDTVSSGEGAPFKVGCSMMLKHMPLGAIIHGIELYPGRGGMLVRAAGLSARLMARNNGYATLKMPSGEVRMVREECRATFGVVSNAEWSLRIEGKAGRNRHRGFRPTVRGTAMNPVDHPHGGGEGRHNGYIPRTPWGMQTKGFRTRSKKKSGRLLVKDRRKK